jgi:hypothetical protein
VTWRARRALAGDFITLALWEREELADIMYACIILHSMIVDDERDDYDIPDDNTYEQGPFGLQNNHMHGPIYGFADVLEKNKEIRDRPTHPRLKEDLMEHLCKNLVASPHSNIRVYLFLIKYMFY